MESARVPVISLTGPTDPVNEGEEMTFTITANESTDADLAIAVSVGDLAGRTGQFVENETRYERLPAGQTTATFTVSTIHDRVDEVDGVVKVEIGTNNTIYTLNQNASIVLVDVLDIDGAAPISVSVSISPTKQSIVEGDTSRISNCEI